MSRRVGLRPEAMTDLREAFRWYQQRRAGLGHEFLRAVRGALATIGGTPAIFPLADGDIRKVPLERFPYMIYFVELPDGISVLAIMHGRRHPRRWRSRR